MCFTLWSSEGNKKIIALTAFLPISHIWAVRERLSPFSKRGEDDHNTLQWLLKVELGPKQHLKHRRFTLWLSEGNKKIIA